MKADAPIEHVILDFDGTCTQIPPIFEDYLERFRRGLGDWGLDVSEPDWRESQSIVREHSPQAGWTLGGCPAAPAAADPYILAYEASQLILRRRGKSGPVPPSVNARAYTEAAAAWRDDALTTFTRLLDQGCRLHLVSNSSTAFISEHLRRLFGGQDRVPANLSVQGDAGKFRICEPSWDDQASLSTASLSTGSLSLGILSTKAKAKFAGLPPASGDKLPDRIERPIYLRRGAYFEAINRALSGDFDALERTLFCGDIWEMDLAMPHALGARVHLVTRAPPFDTYSYEKEAIAACGERGKSSPDLLGLFAWF
jgi:hypothetical protein